MTLDAADARALERAVELARRGIGEVEPNPPVGAVLYVGDRILGEGLHRAYGEDHAEVEALRAAGPVPAEASLAVTLEPCCSEGKRPPCSRAIRRAGVRRVVVGATDPDPRHRGRGLDELRGAGVEVVEAPAGAVPAELLAEFEAHLGRDRPYVVLKWAMALDGSWGPARGSDRKVSGEAAWREVHRLRGRVDGIVVGSGTVLEDDPLMTARPPGPRCPVRVVLDARGRLQEGCRLVRTASEAPLLWVTDTSVTRELPGVTHVALPSPHRLAASVLPALQERGVSRLLVEGGPRLAAAFLEEAVVDRAWVFLAPRVFTGEQAGGVALRPPAVALGRFGRPRLERVEQIGCDAWLRLSWFSRA